jgi:integrase
MASAWICQDHKQVAKHGGEAASWYVRWYDADDKLRCKSFGPGPKGRAKAERQRILIEEGKHDDKDSRKKWSDFRADYESKVIAGLSPRSQEEVKAALDHFERLCSPKKVATIRTKTIDDFIALRRVERGQMPGSTISPATVNKDLRHIRAALRKAARWGYLTAAPCFDMVREPEKEVVYVTPEHFAAIYKVLDQAELPAGQPYPAGDWWKALVVFLYAGTGWRIRQTLDLRREDVDLDVGTASSRHRANKGKRDMRSPLSPVVVDHLRKLTGFSPFIFPWSLDKSFLYKEWARLQKLAGIHLACHEDHEHTDACHRYGFHDLRRGFATLNDGRVTESELQKLMQHRSYSTTKRYINMGQRLNGAAAKLYVPEVLKAAHMG